MDAQIGAGLLAIILIFGSLFVAVIGGLALGAWAIWRKTAPRQGHLAQADEAKMIQELYQGLLRMEERVETLETLLLDQERKGEGKQ
jgi:phage shock protein B